MGLRGDGSGREGDRSRPFGVDDDYPTATGTRTRLPDGEVVNDIYGGARRQPPRLGRSLVTVLGVTVLLIAALAFANRGDQNTSNGARDSAREAAEVQPTAPTGEQPVTGSTNGIPAGFAHTRQGAQSAAANYAVALGSTDMFDSARRNVLIDTIIAADARETFRKSLDKAYTPAFFRKLGLEEDGQAPDGLTFVSRTVPVGTRITAYTEEAATVEVWCTGLLGLAGVGSTNPVTDGWFTLTMELRWTDGDWKITDTSQKDGPAPVNGDTRASGAEEIAEAVEQFGGFTYAR